MTFVIRHWQDIASLIAGLVILAIFKWVWEA